MRGFFVIIFFIKIYIYIFLIAHGIDCVVILSIWDLNAHLHFVKFYATSLNENCSDMISGTAVEVTWSQAWIDFPEFTNKK